MKQADRIDIEFNRPIQTFITSVYTMLQSSGEVAISRLEETYRNMQPVIHEKCALDQLDVSALVYAAMRLPASMMHVHKVFFGQSERIFNEHGVVFTGWTEVSAKARRRRYIIDSDGTMAAFIASKSDIDDLIPLILAYQIEWNKAHALLSAVAPATAKIKLQLDPGALEKPQEYPLENTLGISPSDLSRLKMVWEDNFPELIEEMRRRPCSISIRNIEASYCRYRREADEWWDALARQFPDIEQRPIYFVSSNTHSLINVLSGFAGSYKEEILDFARTQPALAKEYARWNTAVEEGDLRAQQNILYYLLKKFLKSTEIPDIESVQREFEQSSGIFRFSSTRTLDIPAQIIDVRRLSRELIDQGLYEEGRRNDLSFLKKSNALILNIDYPLGRTAYLILTKIAEHVPKILGVYVVGKAASLTADCGDILIPGIVHDQHTQNTYMFENCFSSEQFDDFLEYGGRQVYDNQKAITVLGTFIQNEQLIESIFRSGFTDLEMEAGPYLSALYEMLHPKRHPEGETINYRSSDIDLGIVHYVSDNPLRGKSLGDKNLAMDGIESTYAATLNVVKRIFSREKERGLM